MVWLQKKVMCADILLSACRDSADLIKGTLLIYPSKRYEHLFFRQAMQRVTYLCVERSLNRKYQGWVASVGKQKCKLAMLE